MNWLPNRKTCTSGKSPWHTKKKNFPINGKPLQMSKNWQKQNSEKRKRSLNNKSEMIEMNHLPHQEIPDHRINLSRHMVVMERRKKLLPEYLSSRFSNPAK